MLVRLETHSGLLGATIVAATIETGEVEIKDLIEGGKAAESIVSTA